ncbi:MAG: permease [Clostridia bacterium]|nr:permease [Clostridia bacterium]
MENQNKKSLKWLWISIAIVVVAALVAWCVYNAVKDGDITTAIEIKSTPVLFILIFVICALGYLLGGVTIKGVNLGTAGVFLVAILFGFLCTLDFGNVPILGSFHVTHESSIVSTMGGPIQNLGLIMFVGSVGLIAGPNFFKNLKKNFKTYIVLGAIIILSSTTVAVIFSVIFNYGSGFWAGILSGALTTTPGFSAAQEAVLSELQSMPEYAGMAVEKLRELPEYAIISVGHAIAYPFGVVGVVLFVQLMPKFLKTDMEKERELLKIGAEEEVKNYAGLFEVEPFGLVPIALTVVTGLLLGAIKIPLFEGSAFSLGTTGGVLIMGLVLGHFGKIGKLSLQVPESTLKLLREFGLMLFLLGAGFDGGVKLVSSLSGADGAGKIIWGFVGGACMTIAPMLVGFFLAKFAMKMPLLNTLGSITGGMTSTPALGTLINTAKTEDVASAYASTYPIALVLVVLACQLMITFI